MCLLYFKFLAFALFLQTDSGPHDIKMFISTQRNMKLYVLIKTKVFKAKDFSCFKALLCCIYTANKCKNSKNCWHFDNYEHD